MSDARDVEDALRAATAELVRSMGPGTPPPVRHGRGRKRLVLAAVVVAAILVIGIVGGRLLMSSDSDPTPVAVTTPTDDARPDDGSPPLSETPEPVAPGVVRLDPGPVQHSLPLTSAWTGEELVVVFEGEPEGPGQMSAYRPASDEWRAIEPVPVVVDTRAPRPFALWTESEVLLVSGQNVAAWDPEGDLWRTFEFPAALDADAAEQRLGTAQALLDSAIWTGDEVIVHWAVDDRWFALEPTTGTWRELPPAPSRLYSASAVWTGTEMIVVGAGHDTRALPPDPSSQPRLDAMAFEPNSDAWRSLPSASMDPQMTSAAWTGDDLVVVSYQGATLSYDTVTSSWLEGATLSPYALGGWVAALDVVDGRVVVSIPGGSLAQLTEDWEDFAPIVSSANRVGVADGFMYVVGTLQDDDESPRSFLALEVSELAN